MQTFPRVFCFRKSRIKENCGKDGLKRFTNDSAVLLPYLTHRLVSHTLQTSFAQFSFLGGPLFADFNSLRSAIPLSCLSTFNSTLVFRVPAKSKLYFHRLTFDRQKVVDVSRLHINEGARRNKQCAGCRRFPLPPPPLSSREPLFPSPFPFLALATQASVRQAISFPEPTCLLVSTNDQKARGLWERDCG